MMRSSPKAKKPQKYGPYYEKNPYEIIIKKIFECIRSFLDLEETAIQATLSPSVLLVSNPI